VLHLPVADVCIPDGDFERAWESEGEKLRSMLRNGLDVLLHCRGGLGRAGTSAARLLLELGMEPLTAIGRVREVRPGIRYDKHGKAFPASKYGTG
jgi:ADP-ribosyl-[dinitrogen reductase] hydrolase